MNYFFFLQQTVPQIIQNTPHKEAIEPIILVYVICTALIATGGLIAWFIISNIINQAKKRTEAFVKSVEDFQKAIDGMKNLTNAIDEAKLDIIQSVEETIERKSPPPSKSFAD